MRTMLTLLLDDRLIRRAKAHAHKTGKSVSQMVADYFALLGRLPAPADFEPTATVKTLRGSLKSAGSAEATEAEYRQHLEEKHW